jgi:pimeloyl-ACP methyl ester carboxylesterase
MENPLFVLVHGAWSGAWCWRDLATELERRSVRVACVDLASSRTGAPAKTDLEHDVRVVLEATKNAGPVILVGHSYGGMVITEAAPHVTELERLAYLSALVPSLGESATDVTRLVRVRTELDDAIEVHGEHLLLNPQRATSALYGECDKEVQKWAISKLTTQTIASFRSPRTADASIAPTLYVKCRNDRAIDPGLQNVMATRCDEHVELESDHSPFLSHPRELAIALLD